MRSWQTGVVLHRDITNLSLHRANSHFSQQDDTYAGSLLVAFLMTARLHLAGVELGWWHAPGSHALAQRTDRLDALAGLWQGLSICP